MIRGFDKIQHPEPEAVGKPQWWAALASRRDCWHGPPDRAVWLPVGCADVLFASHKCFNPKF